jgi:hypothetical protein
MQCTMSRLGLDWFDLSTYLALLTDYHWDCYRSLSSYLPHPCVPTIVSSDVSYRIL